MKLRWYASICIFVCALTCLAAPAAGLTGGTEPGRPELILQIGHSNVVARVAWSPDGRLIATSGDTTVRIWDSATGRELRAFDGGGREAVFSPDGRMIAVASLGTKPQIQVLDVETGRRYQAFAAGSGGALAIAFSPDGRRLAAGGIDKIVRLWDLETGELLRTFEGHASLVPGVVFDPAGRWLATASRDRTVKLWNVETGAVVRELTGSASGLDSIAVSPDGRWLASELNRTSAIMIWDAETGRVHATIRDETPFRGLDFSRDGRWLAAGCEDGAVKLFEVATGRPARSFARSSAATGRTTPAPADVVSDVAFSPDGTRLAVARLLRTVSVWDFASEKRIVTLGGRAAGVYSLAFSADGRHLGVGRDDGAVKLWDLQAGRQIHGFGRMRAPVRHLAFTPDGATLAARGGDLVLLDVVTGWVVRREALAQGTGVAIGPDGARLAAGADIQGRVVLTNAADGASPTFLSAGPLGAQDLAFSPDGRRLAVAIGKRGLKVVTAGKAPQPEPPCEVHVFTLGASDPPLRLAGHPEWVLAVAWSPDGRLLASSGNKGEVKMWDVGAEREVHTLSRPGSGVASDVAWSPDGRLLAVSYGDGIVGVWDVATGTLARTLEGHGLNVETVAFSPDGRRLLSGGSDGSTRVWDPSNGEQLATIALLDGKNWLVTTPDGYFDGTPDAWSAILWRFSDRLEDVAPVEAFFGDFYRPGLLAEVMAGPRPRPPTDFARKDRRLPTVRLSTVSAPARGARSVRVRIDAREAAPGSGVRDVRLFRNGSLVKVWRGDLPGGAATMEATVPIVAGVNRLTAYAFNRDDVKSEDARLGVIGSSGLERKGTLYVVSIGVNRYANPEFDLRFAVADAKEFAGEFAARQVALGRCADTVVDSITDAQATRAGILAALDRLAKAGPEDTVVVFFAGHGLAHGDRFYLVPHDLGFTGRRAALRESEVERVLRSSVSDQDLERAFERIDAGNLLLVVDACDSGKALETSDPRFGPTNSRGLAQLAYEKGMYVLAGSQAYQAALEAGSLGHGYLTYALVEEGLKTAAADTSPADGEVLVGEWLDYAVDRVPDMQRTRLSEARKIGLREDAVSPVQRPRLFTRREEAGTHPFPVARP